VLPKLARLAFGLPCNYDLIGANPYEGVIPTFLIDFPVVFAFGLGFALFVLPEERVGSLVGSRAFRWGLGLTTLFLISALISAAGWPDWMWMYYAESPPLGFWGYLYIAVFLYYVPYYAGFHLSEELTRRVGRWAGAVLVAVCLVVEYFLCNVIWPDRYYAVGTREEWLAGTAKNLGAANLSLSWVFALFTLLMIGWAGFFIWRVYLPARRRAKEEG
jgi:hypothetical protein